MHLSAYYDAAKIDFFGPFANLWIGFNAWSTHRCGKKTSDIGKCLGMASVFQSWLESELDGLNSPDSFVAEQLGGLSGCDCTGYSYTRDLSGLMFRLQCKARNYLTEFLQAASRHPTLKEHTTRLRFLSGDESSDALFERIYRKWRQWEATEEGILEPADAMGIRVELRKAGVQLFGHLLFHDPREKPADNTLYSVDDIFQEPSSQGVAKHASQSSDVQCITTQFLFAVYKFRCAYFHGELDPQKPDSQDLARLAYFSLRSVIEATMPKPSAMDQALSRG